MTTPRVEIPRVNGLEVEGGVEGDRVRRLSLGSKPRHIPSRRSSEGLDVQRCDRLDATSCFDARNHLIVERSSERRIRVALARQVELRKDEAIDGKTHVDAL